MMRKFLLATAIAVLSLSTAQAQPSNAGSVALERGGISAQEAKVTFHFAFGQPYYGRPYYYQPYYAPYQDPYQYCHLGVCY